MSHYNEDTLEQTILERLAGLDYQIVFGPDIAVDGISPERQDYQEVILTWRLKRALIRINPNVWSDAIDEAIKKVRSLTGNNLLALNFEFHKLLTDGIDVSVRKAEGDTKTEKLWLIDKNNMKNNEFAAVNQFTIIEGKHQRRPDVILFINGLPLVVIELKNLADETTDIKKAFHQIQTYKQQIPSLFVSNAFCVISDGIEAKLWTISSDMDRFMSWKSVDGQEISSPTRLFESLVYGVFTPERLVDIVLNFIVFEKEKNNTIKKIAAYHQYFAVQKAISTTFEAVNQDTRKCWVVRHTQGSGKSLTMVFYSWKIIQKLDNPTILVITDRNDLDDQLFGTFAKCEHLLRQSPKQAKDSKDLKKLLSVASWWVVFTTMQKFVPEDGSVYDVLSERKNIIVIADEAHRSQYGFKAKIKDDNLSYGFAKYLRDALPNASYIWFTGTPIEFTDKNTKTVFGDYIDIYDISRAVEDHATVPIYYEARLAKIQLLESERPRIDEDFEEITEGEESGGKEKLKSKWAKLEAMVGTENRLTLVAQDIINHFEKRIETIEGKGMIVCMSRRIAVELYQKIIELRPERDNEDDDKWFIKTVITGNASDPLNYQPHVRNKKARDDMAKRMRDPKDPLKLVIVRDMWLTGFDVPCMHTMYIDKPMQGHGLMQAIARVNRVWKDKQAGLIVDYLGIANQLKQAMAYYSESGWKGETVVPMEDAIKVMKEKYEVVKELYHGFDYMRYFSWTPAQRTETISSAMEHILSLEDGKKRYIQSVTDLSFAFSIAIPSIPALDIRDEVAFFQAIKAGLVKFDETWWDKPKASDDYDQAIKQIISWAVVSDEVIDIFDVAGIKKPDISILSDEFLEEVRSLKQTNLALELLKKLIGDNIKTLTRKNLVQSRSFADMLEKTIKKYQNRTIESAQVIAELIELAKKINEEQQKGKDLWLTEDEIAFYDALVMNESAVRELWDEILRAMTHELVKLIRDNTTIDWNLKENVQARLRLYVKRLLKKYNYPPDFQEQATDLVLQQAELTCKEM